MYLSTYLKNKIIDHVLRNTSYTPSSPLYIALYTDNPGDDDAGTEISGYNYARAQAPAFTVSGSAASNTNQVFFPPATGNWGMARYYGIRTSATTGSMLLYGTISDQQGTSYIIIGGAGSGTIAYAGKYIYSGDIFHLGAGKIRITLSGAYSTYLSGKLLDFVLNNVSYPSPGTNVYAALYNTLPDSDDSGGVEVSGAGYSRVQISGTGWSSPSAGETHNTSSLNFTSSAPADWGIIQGICLRDNISAGNMLFRGALSPVATVLTGDSYEIEAGKLSVTIF